MLLSLDQQFTMNPNDPTLGGLYGQQQRHAMLSRAFELMNIKGGSQYLADPNSPEFQQMQQQQAEEAQMAQARAEEVEKFQAGMTARQVAVMEGQLELEVLKEQNRMMLEMQKQEFEEETEESRLVMEAEKTKHDMRMRDAELQLERSQNRNVSIGS